MAQGEKYQVWQYCEGINDRTGEKFIYSRDVTREHPRAKALSGVFVCEAGNDVFSSWFLERWLPEPEQKNLLDQSGGEFVPFRRRVAVHYSRGPANANLGSG
jgi:hypothetical protein